MAAIVPAERAPLLNADMPMQQWAELTNRVRAQAAGQRCPLRWLALIAIPAVVQRLAGASCPRQDQRPASDARPEEGWQRLGRFTGLSLAAFVMIAKVNRSNERNPRGVSAVVRVLGWQVANTALLLAPRER